jgi:hypothetical protein
MIYDGKTFAHFGIKYYANGEGIRHCRMKMICLGMAK